MIQKSHLGCKPQPCATGRGQPAISGRGYPHITPSLPHYLFIVTCLVTIMPSIMYIILLTLIKNSHVCKTKGYSGYVHVQSTQVSKTKVIALKVTWSLLLLNRPLPGRTKTNCTQNPSLGWRQQLWPERILGILWVLTFRLFRLNHSLIAQSGEAQEDQAHLVQSVDESTD